MTLLETLPRQPVAGIFVPVFCVISLRTRSRVHGGLHVAWLVVVGDARHHASALATADAGILLKLKALQFGLLSPLSI